MTSSAETAGRRRAAAVAGHRSDEGTARALLDDEAAAVRAGALGALARMERLTADDLRAALGDADPGVRRRACEEAGRRPGVSAPVWDAVVARVDDADPSVAEFACWALGEGAARPGIVETLARTAGSHRDALCREAAVAALGALGDVAGLPAILAALGDKPAVRRRAVLALAPFDGPEVEQALRRASADRDWQVRQAAEDLLAEGGDR